MQFDPVLARKNRDKLNQSQWDLEDAQSLNQSVIREFLQESGWTHHCDLPGSFLLWRKTFNGREVNVDQSTAIRIESEIQEFDFLEDDEC